MPGDGPLEPPLRCAERGEVQVERGEVADLGAPGLAYTRKGEERARTGEGEVGVGAYEVEDVVEQFGRD